MKKSLVLMAMAGVALASCVNDVADVAQEQKKVKIAFDTPVLYNNAESRANVYGEIGSHTYEGSSTVYTYPKEENFQIFAVQHEGNLTGWENAEAHEMNNTSVSYDESVDGWAPKQGNGDYYVWPSETMMMSFAASSPADLGLPGATRTYGANGLTIQNFEVQSQSAKQYDLLFAQRAVNKTSGNMLHGASYYSGIPLNFEHALSSVRFSVQNETDAVVVLNEVRVGGVKYKGTFTENLTEGAEKYTAAPAWVVDAALNSNVNLKENPTAGYLGFKGAVTFSREARYVAAIAASDTDAEGENEQSHQLILMPQELGDEAEIYVGYTVNGNFHSKVAKIKGLLDVKGVAVNKWDMGVRYTYRLVYSSSTAAKDVIYFAPGAEAWVEHDVIVVEL